jgi:diketogulonate reductase-like aldo/keto reductase
VRQPDLFTIPKAGRGPHVTENAHAGDLVLTPEELALLDGAFPLGRRRSGVPIL